MNEKTNSISTPSNPLNVLYANQISVMGVTSTIQFKDSNDRIISLSPWGVGISKNATSQGGSSWSDIVGKTTTAVFG